MYQLLRRRPSYMPGMRGTPRLRDMQPHQNGALLELQWQRRDRLLQLPGKRIDRIERRPQFIDLVPMLLSHCASSILTEQPIQLIARNGPAEEIPLSLVAIVFPEIFEIFSRFNSLSNHTEILARATPMNASATAVPPGSIGCRTPVHSLPRPG